MGLPFDSYQVRACQVDRNAVVMAGAGSGKTSVLAERFAWLLETRRAKIEEILCLTFTRKATAEMVEKIYRRLRDCADPDIQEQLARFDQAQISTLDSFCTQVVRNACQRFGLPPDFRNEEEELRRLVRETAFQFLLSHLDHPGLARLLEQHGFERIADGVFVELALQHFPLTAEYDFPAMAETQVQTLRRELDRHLRDWAEARGKLLQLPPRIATIRENQAVAAAVGEPEELARRGRFADLAAALADFKLSRRGGGAEDSRLMKELADRLMEEAGEIALIASTLEQEDALRELLPLLGRFQETLNQAKRRQGLLSFQDVAHMAVEALRRDASLRQFYKRQFRFIMIDEFQDNNRLQRDLLYLLAERRDRCADRIPRPEELEPDKLFFVGDEKQSIYRFRGADVSVFKSLSDELEAQGGQPLELPTNYRSEPGLILFFNRLFERVMAGAEAPYEARFRPLERRAPANRQKPEILFLYKPPAPRGEARSFRNEEVEAFCLAETIRQAVDGQRLTIAEPDEAGTVVRRPAAFDDFALLLRSTGNQILYERVFRRFAIPYTTQNARSLFLEAPLYDFYQLLQAAMYPEDRLAYAALLRSPLVNVSDAALLRILDDGAAPFETAGLAGLEAEDRERLAMGRRLWTMAQEEADRVPLAVLVDRLWAEGGYTFFILRNPQNHNFLEYREYLIRMAERADRSGATLAQFLDYLRENLGSYERQEELEILKGRTAGVQILTIHRAKGLEFPIVILADMGNRGRSNQEASSPCYYLPEYGFTFNLGRRNWFARLGREEEEKEEIAELKRLLYVAFTRARSHLIVSGAHGTQNQACPRAHLNMLLAGLEVREPQELEEDLPDYRFRLKFMREVGEAEYWRPLPSPGLCDLEDLARRYEAAEESRRASDPAFNIVRELTVTGLAKRIEEEALAERAGSKHDLPPLSIDGLLQERESNQAFGELTHELLQRRLLGDEGPITEDWIPDALAGRFPPGHLPEILAEARRLAGGFLGSELGRRALAAKNRFPEYAFLHRRGRYWINGRVDLYFEEEGRVWLVDFKTDRSYREGQYDAQLELYRLALRELTDREIACRVFLLRSGQALAPAGGLDVEGWLQRLLPGEPQPPAASPWPEPPAG
jgi:ATP-dependent exoDNAse (exonuclease V) beta subunit